MRKFLSRFFPVIPVAFVIGSMIFSHSCANTTQPPSGGPRDTIPPVLVKIVPETNVLGVPLEGAVFTFTFDEYFTVKTPTNIFLSPPQNKPPKYKIHGKSLQITFEEPLDSNTTYTLNLANAIADNNEGNMFPGFTYVFSTGDSIDSLMITGLVQDCSTLAPAKGVTVMLYKDLADSAVVLSRPFAAAKTDDWGYFCIRNLADTNFRLYAVKDDNNNNIYDPAENELIAFVDSVIRPTMVVNDTLPELRAYDMKDTLGCQSRKTEYELNLFRARPSKQYITNQGRLADRYGFVAFMAPDAHIDSMWVRGVQADRLITQFNIERDSLLLWVNDSKKMPDTLHVYVNYRKTDTLGKLVPFTEHVKLFTENAGKTASKSSRRDFNKEDTLCKFKLEAAPDKVEQIGYKLEFDSPIVYESFDKVRLVSINPKQVESLAEYEVIPDTLDIRKFTIKPKTSLLPGYDYVLKMPHRGFRDINGYFNDSLDVKVTLPTDEKLSTLNLVVEGVTKKYIVDLLSEKRDVVLRSYIITEPTTLVFPYLKTGNYCIRITEDVNRNGFVDTGSLFDHRQPEKVKFMKFNEDIILKMLESTVIDQMVDVGELFAN